MASQQAHKPPGSAPPQSPAPIRIGVSACLVGHTVRYDAGHKRDSFVSGQLAEHFELVPVCPEVAIGLGTPREPICLSGNPETPRAVGTRTPSLEVTEALSGYGRRMAAELGEISGYVFKSRSPSCGMERVEVHGAAGPPACKGRGIYARALMRARPLLPCEEEGRLGDPGLRENFIGRVLAFRRWQDLLAGGVTAERLVDFHTAHKLILMAHGRESLRRLGRLVAEAGQHSARALADEYGPLFMQALAGRATRRRHSDVLYHLLSYLKRKLDAGDKAELVALIEEYRLGRVPLIEPVALLRHHFRVHPDPYIDRQLYLSWPPAGLSLWSAT
ncbi:MAG TPA: DUF523 and DUF1722 domain-containing protein [Gammaproteobacteria bacterium]|nr:DUF523 and DUF1722 domain-containing protein [Gammaproteobacteria bacterium]